MKKVLFELLVCTLLIVIVVPIISSGEGGNNKENTLMETLYVDSTNPNLVWSNTVLETGHNYLIQVNGTFNFDCENNGECSSDVADAEYVTDDDWETAEKNYTFGETVYPHVLDLLINEEDIDCGEYNPDHIYTHYMIGNGSKISFVVSDWYGPDYPHCKNNGCTYDNEGIFTVKIYSVSSSDVDGNDDTNGGSSTDNKGTTGFDLILLLIAIVVIICIIVVSILLWKKKKKKRNT
jgi:hypothetical protein